MEGIEQHWREKEVAKRLGVSPQTVKRRFADRPGVRTIGTETSTRSKRRYAIRLIPESVVQEYLKEIER